MLYSVDPRVISKEIVNLFAKHELQINSADLVFEAAKNEMLKQVVQLVKIREKIYPTNQRINLNELLNQAIQPDEINKVLNQVVQPVEVREG